jgi:hypothetical protein
LTTTRPQGRNWPQILADLDTAGVNNATVARECNVARSTVAKWLRGAEPLHCYGEIVITLHTRHCRSQSVSVEIS